MAREVPGHVVLLARASLSPEAILEVLGVTNVRYAAIGVVQVEVETAKLTGIQYRILVSQVGHTQGDTSVPGSEVVGLKVMRGPGRKSFIGTRQTIALGTDVVEVVGEGEVTESIDIGQHCTPAWQTLLTGNIVTAVSLVTPGVACLQFVAQTTGITKVKIGAQVEVKTTGFNRTQAGKAGLQELNRSIIRITQQSQTQRGIGPR